MKKIGMVLLAGTAFCGAQIVAAPVDTQASNPAVVKPADEVAAVKAAMEKMAPGTKIDRIKLSSLPAIYEVTLGAEVIYVSKDGRYMFQGDLIDIEAKKNLTEDQRAQGRIKLVAAVKPSDMIIFAPKKPKHIVSVFTDIDCPYCRKMHDEIAEYNRLGIEIRYLAFPRAGINTESYNKMVAVFCAPDRKAALTAAKANKPVPAKTCANPVDAHMRLVGELGLNGTPSLILKDGSVIPGYLPADRLAAALNEKFKL